MKVSIANYGVGNIRSISKAVERCGYVPSLAQSPADLISADTLIFPGVGSFGAGARWFKGVEREMFAGRAILGICLGEQILFEASDESAGRGLSILQGRVRKLPAAKLPNVGWAPVEWSDEVLFEGIGEGSCFYFTHSYYASPEDQGCVSAVSSCEGGSAGNLSFPCAVRRGRVAGVQFHPEKSSVQGMRLLRNFLSFAEGV